MTIKSMTGFARSDGSLGPIAWHWEVRSVNGRGLDMRLRLPAGYEAMEARIREAVSKRIVRGNLTVNLNVKRSEGETRIKLNEAALRQVLAVLEGTGTETVDTRDGKVVLDVSALIDQVKKTLDDRGITIFDNVGKNAPQEFVLFESEQLTKAQSGVRLLKTLTYVLPFLTLLAFAAAVALSPNRRRTLLRSALAFAFTMALVLIAFNLGRGAYLDAIENAGKSREAGAAAFDQILDFLRVTLRTAFALGLVIAVGAWLAGPGRLATRIREGVSGLVRGGGEGDVTPVGRFVNSYRVPLRVLVFGIGLLILVVLSHPGPLAVVVVAVLVVVGLLLIEFLGRTAHRAHAAVGGGTGDGRDT